MTSSAPTGDKTVSIGVEPPVALAGVGLWQVHQRTCHPLYSSTWGVPPVSVGERHDRIQERLITLLGRPLSRSPVGDGICVLIKMHRAVPIGIDDPREVLCKPGLALSASCSTPMPLRVWSCDPKIA
jgi:hypothetical protein